jgi:hypothetical protein
MTYDLERRLRDGLAQAKLPAAPVGLRDRVEGLDYRPLVSASSPPARRRWALPAGIAALVLVVGLIGVVAGTRPPIIVDGLRVLTVGELLDARTAGQLAGDRVAVGGYWSFRPASTGFCGPVRGLVACNQEPGTIAELPESPYAFEHGYPIPPVGRYLEPVMPGDAFDLGRLTDNAEPRSVVPIVVVGHFDDPRSDNCPDVQACRDLFVVDRLAYVGAAVLLKPAPCYSSELAPLGPPWTIDAVAGRSSLIALVSFHGFGDSFWNTFDGQPPAVSQLPQDALILTAVTVNVERPIRGAPGGSRLAVRAAHCAGAAFISTLGRSLEQSTPGARRSASACDCCRFRKPNCPISTRSTPVAAFRSHSRQKRPIPCRRLPASPKRSRPSWNKCRLTRGPVGWPSSQAGRSWLAAGGSSRRCCTFASATHRSSSSMLA